MKNIGFLLLILFAFIPPVFPQAGLLDVTFDTDGKLITAFLPAGNAQIFALAIQPDQKIVAAGTARGSNNNEDFALTRYHPDGSPDANFGSGGKSLLDFGLGHDAAKSMVLQPDGKIIVAGYAFNGTHPVFALARFLENGDPDTTFGVLGHQTTAIVPGKSEASSVALQADGKIVVAGTAYLNSTQGLFALARYDTLGILDTTFGLGGILLTAIDSLDDHAQAVAIQPDQKIIVAGYARHGVHYDFVLARYHPTGSPDTPFGMHGQQVTDFSGFDDYGQAMALQPDGKIVVAGSTASGTTQQYLALARYDANGFADSTFGTYGKMKTNFNSVKDGAQAVALQPDGKIVTAGYTYISIFQTFNFALARYLPDGKLDLDFNTTGKVTTAFQVGNDQSNAVAMQADGRIVAGGRTSQGEFALARYLSGLNIDATDTPISNQPGFLYPNPVQDAVALEYSLQQDGPVHIVLYDQAGRIIARLADQVAQTAGRHIRSLLLPANLAPGIYFIVLATSSGHSTWKMVK